VGGWTSVSYNMIVFCTAELMLTASVVVMNLLQFHGSEKYIGFSE